MAVKPWVASLNQNPVPLQRPVIALTLSHDHIGAGVALQVWIEALLLFNGWEGMQLCASQFYAVLLP